jgi:hypothetical protein
LDNKIKFSLDQKGLYILVKWEGYDDPTWEPRKNFMHFEVFHDYCSANKLKRFIPKGHKYQQQDSEDNTSNNDEESK